MTIEERIRLVRSLQEEVKKQLIILQEQIRIEREKPQLAKAVWAGEEVDIG